jgi:hypothetical protein
LTDLGAQALDLRLVFRVLIFASGLERLDAGAMIFIGPTTVVVLRESVLAAASGTEI